MKTTQTKSPLTRGFVYLLACCFVSQPAFGAGVTISPTPLATAGGSSVLPNLLFTLDGSGSMDFDFLPDYLSYKDNGDNQCMTRSTNGTDCQAGDPAWYAGGSGGANGVGYDPKFSISRA
jgi:type IV pilus assembly protein PilY1